MWNKKFSGFIQEFGLVQSSADPCVCSKKNENEFTVVIIYVDDGIICSTSNQIMQNIVSYLGSHFKIRAFTPNRFLGLDITKDRVNCKIFISQKHFIEKLLNRFNLSECNPKCVPADPCSRLTKKMCSNQCPVPTEKQ